MYEGGLVAGFMKATSQRKDQVKLVLGFCSDKVREELERGPETASVVKNCLLDDRSSDGKHWTSRGYYGPLSARELQLKLQCQVRWS